MSFPSPAADYGKTIAANRLVDALTPDEKLKVIRELDSEDWSVARLFALQGKWPVWAN